MRYYLALTAVALSAAAPAQQVKTTIQQDFDAATALTDNRSDAAALAAWSALQGRIGKNARTRAIIDVRKSGVLLRLGRLDDAIAAARAGLAGLPTADVTLREDRHNAFLTLGAIGEASLDYASAAEAYAQAETLGQQPIERLAALRGLIATATFVDPALATKAVVRADAALGEIKTDATVRAVIRRLNGELLLNQGALEASRRELAIAVKLLGGLTAQTRLDDVVVRSDYAIASLLAGKTDEARKYMAMTGAGRLTKGSFDPGLGMKVPECGGDAGLKPNDVAVIDFSIGDDGTVSDSQPVYAAGGGQVALEFARAARNWSWTAEQAKAMPLFYRNRVRVELRCSTAFERPSVGSYLNGDFGAWLASKNVKMPPLLVGADAVVLPQLRAQLAQTEVLDGRDALVLVPILHLLASNLVVGRDESNAFARRELAIADANNVTPVARLAIETKIWDTGSAERARPKVYAKLLASQLSAARYAANPAARSAIRLMIADAVRDDARARVLLDEVGAEDGLPPNHPLRVGALVRLASLEQEDGNPAAASAAFAKSGLSAQQCALVDSAPKFLGTGASSNDFPMEALQWGFEGWTQTQFDISADGKVINERVVTAYPPFVFSKAGAGVVRTARYEKSYRPDGGLGCGGSGQRVRFSLP